MRVISFGRPLTDLLTTLTYYTHRPTLAVSTRAPPITSTKAATKVVR